MRIRSVHALLSLLVPGCAETKPPAPPPPVVPRALYAWVQLGPQDTVSVRAVIPLGTTCPAAVVDGRGRALSVRAPPQADGANPENPAHRPAFPVTVCELSLPRTGLGVLSLEGRPLRMPPPTISRVVVLGDTGCRLKVPAAGKGDPVQDCADERAWPWARVAAAAAAQRPDLVLHVGDYHYREVCAQGEACARARAAGPVGYHWAAWEADFFRPAGALLAGTPWLFVRGNHETCERAGEGWKRLFAPGGYQACPDQRRGTPTHATPSNDLTESPYQVALGPELSFFVVDTSALEDFKGAGSVAADVLALEQASAGLDQVAPSVRVWVTTHKPLWFELVRKLDVPNAWQLAARRTFSERVDLLFAGHEHAFETLEFGPNADPGFPKGRPAQVIVGGGGSQLEALDPGSPLFEGGSPGSRERAVPGSDTHEGVVPVGGVVVNRYSFLLLERTPAGWMGSVLDEEGKLLSRCLVGPGKRFSCGAAPPHE